MLWKNCVCLPEVGKQNATFSPDFTKPGKSLVEVPCIALKGPPLSSACRPSYCGSGYPFVTVALQLPTRPSLALILSHMKCSPEILPYHICECVALRLSDNRDDHFVDTVELFLTLSNWPLVQRPQDEQ